MIFITLTRNLKPPEGCDRGGFFARVGQSEYLNGNL